MTRIKWSWIIKINKNKNNSTKVRKAPKSNTIYNVDDINTSQCCFINYINSYITLFIIIKSGLRYKLQI